MRKYYTVNPGRVRNTLHSTRACADTTSRDYYQGFQEAGARQRRGGRQCSEYRGLDWPAWVPPSQHQVSLVLLPTPHLDCYLGPDGVQVQPIIAGASRRLDAGARGRTVLKVIFRYHFRNQLFYFIVLLFLSTRFPVLVLVLGPFIFLFFWSTNKKLHQADLVSSGRLVAVVSDTRLNTCCSGADPWRIKG